jgi:hypothetical protein
VDVVIRDGQMMIFKLTPLADHYQTRIVPPAKVGELSDVDHDDVQMI